MNRVTWRDARNFNLLEADELLIGGDHRGDDVGRVDLDDLLRLHLPAVADGDGDREVLLSSDRALAQLQVSAKTRSIVSALQNSE
jgi:hypothetical protein